MSKLKYVLQDLKWLKVLNSPFKPFRVRFYVGKTQVGTPYFLPRKWVKYTDEDAKAAATKAMADSRLVQKSMDEWYNEYKRYNKAVPLKVGFSYCGLGWKTKWTNTDFRYEWGPVLSFVFFGYQIALMIGHKHSSHYWEAWLYYEYATDKTKSKRERIEQCKKEFNQTWKVYSNGEEEIVNYYELILKTKYL
jgi:hypothetical protein